MGIKIISTGMAIPQQSLTNNELCKFVDTTDEWIVSHTGISNRYICTSESLTDLAESAARTALVNHNIQDIDLIICSTVTGDYIVPSLACCLSERLGTNCPAFDVNAACTGFVYGLDVATAYIGSGKAKKVLFVCGDMLTKMTNWSDRSTCVLFGDAAGAMIIEPGDSLKYIRLTATGRPEILHIKGTPPHNPLVDAGENAGKQGYVHMDGQEVFRFAVLSVEKEVNLALETLNLTPDDIKYFLLHQANKRIIESARNRLKQPIEKFPTNIERFSNTTAATIPMLLDELNKDNKLQKGDKLLAIAFGAGLTTGTCIIEW